MSDPDNEELLNELYGGELSNCSSDTKTNCTDSGSEVLLKDNYKSKPERRADRQEQTYQKLRFPHKGLTLQVVMIIDTAIREQPNIVQRQMMSSGELDRMRELLRVRLAECGWKDEMVLLCRKVIAESDINTLTVDDILDKITPQGRALVPDAVKKELLQKIKTYLMEEANLIPPNSNRSNARHRT